MTETITPPTGGKPAGRHGSPTKFIIGGAVIVVAIALLIFTSVGGATTYYVTVGELKAKGGAGVGKKVRVAGLVDGATIQYDQQTLNLSFVMADDSGRLSVVYHGPRPDMLQDQAEAVVEGKLNEQGTFEATNLMLKCPSKYEAAATATAQPAAKK